MLRGIDTLARLWLAGGIILLASCGGPNVSVRDGPPSEAVDLDAIPDAIPRAEPPSRYSNKDYVVWGKRYHVMPSAQGYVERGIASWYGKAFHGKPTSSGEPYDMLGMTAAHKHLPLPTYARVTHLDNGKSIVVRINDRGPFVAGRLIDLSYVAAAKLGISGTGRVEVRALTAADDPPRYTAAAPHPGAASSPETPPDTEQGWYYLQAGAFGERQRALVSQTQLQMELSPPWRAALATGPGDDLWRVRVGPLPDRATALRLQTQLRVQGWETHLVVARPQLQWDASER